MGRIVDLADILLELGLSSSVTEEQRAISDVAITKAEGAIRRYLGYDPVQASRTEYYPQSDLTPLQGPGQWEISGGRVQYEVTTIGASSELYLQHLPIRSITSLGIDYDGRGESNPNASYDAKTAGSDFWANWNGTDDDDAAFCTDGILRSYGLWPETPGSVKVVYVAGYTQAELRGTATVLNAVPIFDAVLEEAIRRAKRVLTQHKKGTYGFLVGPAIEEDLGHYRIRLASVVSERLFGGGWDLLPETMSRLNDFVNYGYRLAG